MVIRVLLADDQPLVRAGIAMLLSTAEGIEVVGEAGDGSAAIAAAQQLRPDLVLMDLRMPGMDGIEATRRLTSADDRADHLVKVLILTTFDDDDAVYGALRAGAHGFLLKHAVPEELVRAIRRVADGDAWIDPSVAGKVISALSAPATSGSPGLSARLARLTPRETEVLVQMAQGLSVVEISQLFVLSEATVKTHVARILMKTASRDRAQAVALAYQSGLVTPG